MPRKVKYGILFHSRDVLFYEEIDVQKAIIYGGAEAGVIYEVLLGKIYQSGHYFKFKDFKDDLVFLFRKDFHFEDERIANAFKVLLDLEFFDKDSFEKGYITSIEIQKFYYQITKSRKITHLDECWLLSDEEMKYIDTPKKQRGKKNQEMNEITMDSKGTAEVYLSTAEQEESTAVTIQGTQSKSNSHSQSQTERKEGLKIQDKGVLPPVIIPAYFDKSFKSFILQGVLSVNDPITEMLNEFFTELRDNYTSRQIRDATMHTLNQLHKNGWVDGDKKPIKDKYRYIKSAMINNLNIIISNENDAEDDRPFIEKLVDNLPGLKKNRTEITS